MNSSNKFTDDYAIIYWPEDKIMNQIFLCLQLMHTILSMHMQVLKNNPHAINVAVKYAYKKCTQQIINE